MAEGMSDDDWSDGSSPPPSPSLPLPLAAPTENQDNRTVPIGWLPDELLRYILSFLVDPWRAIAVWRWWRRVAVRMRVSSLRLGCGDTGIRISKQARSLGSVDRVITSVLRELHISDRRWYIGHGAAWMRGGRATTGVWTCRVLEAVSKRVPHLTVLTINTWYSPSFEVLSRFRLLKKLTLLDRSMIGIGKRLLVGLCEWCPLLEWLCVDGGSNTLCDGLIYVANHHPSLTTIQVPATRLPNLTMYAPAWLPTVPAGRYLKSKECAEE